MKKIYILQDMWFELSRGTAILNLFSKVLKHIFIAKLKISKIDMNLVLIIVNKICKLNYY